MGLDLRTRRWLAVWTVLLSAAAGACTWAVARGSATARALKLSDAAVQIRSWKGVTEVGMLDGASYRIDIPSDWNHDLVVYYHGYAQHPVTFHPHEPLSAELTALLERHYAVAQSAYSQPGWALPQAYPETEALRQYFTHKFGRPLETYAAGRSMGGALVMVTLELNPKPYVGGLDLCGAVGPSSEEFDRRFAQRAAFDVYFPGLMPPLVPVPVNFEANRAQRERIIASLKRNPQAAAAMRSLVGLRSDAELASDMAYFTFVIGEMQRRAGGNPFDNRKTVYSAPDAARARWLNSKARRYAPQPAARAYLLRHYTPSGRLGRPMLALHTAYDPVVPVSQLAQYAEKVEAAGYSSNLVQQYVPRDGHCNVTPQEVGLAFDELVRWTHADARPLTGFLQQPQHTMGLREQALKSAAEPHVSGKQPAPGPGPTTP